MRLMPLLFTLLICCSCSNNAKKPSDQGETPALLTGEELYKANCLQCHLPYKDLVGPGLANVKERWQNIELMYEFVHNPQAVIKKNAYADSLFQKWGRTYMQAYPNLTPRDIEAIIDYCKQQAAE